MKTSYFIRFAVVLGIVMVLGLFEACEQKTETATPSAQAPRPIASPEPTYDRAGREMSTTSEWVTPTPESTYERAGRPARRVKPLPNK